MHHTQRHSETAATLFHKLAVPLALLSTQVEVAVYGHTLGSALHTGMKQSHRVSSATYAHQQASVRQSGIDTSYKFFRFHSAKLANLRLLRLQETKKFAQLAKNA